MRTSPPGSGSPAARRKVPGPYRVNVTLDHANALAEENELNNNVSYLLMIKTFPVANLTFRTVGSGAIIPGKNINFDASGSYSIGGRIYNYHWDFGDHNSQDTNYSNTVHHYTSPGEYLATVVVTDFNGEVSAPASVVVKVFSSTPSPPGFIPGFELLAALAAAGVVSVLAGQRKRK